MLLYRKDFEMSMYIVHCISFWKILLIILRKNAVYNLTGAFHSAALNLCQENWVPVQNNSAQDSQFFSILLQKKPHFWLLPYYNIIRHNPHLRQ